MGMAATAATPWIFLGILQTPTVPLSMPSPARELAAQKIQFKKEQEALFCDLLEVLDGLDQACGHWQRLEAEHQQTLTASEVRSGIRSRPSPGLRGWLRGIWQAIRGRSPAPVPDETPQRILKQTLGEVLATGRSGTEVLQRSLLGVLQKRDIAPLSVVGQPFDPMTMVAVGREESPHIASPVVAQEVIRGYTWGDRMLREAQVIVAVPTASPQSSPTPPEPLE